VCRTGVRAGFLPAATRSAPCGTRYTENYRALVDGMAEFGFVAYLAPEIQSPIIVTFHAPADPRYRFPEFYEAVRERGFILYPGKLTEVPTFRVGCIGAIGVGEMRQAILAIADAMRALGIQSGRPAI